MRESILDVSDRVVRFPVAPQAAITEDVSTTIAAAVAEPLKDCPGCGEIGSATILRTVHAAYFFCSSCTCAWSVELLLARHHRPERRRVRAHRAFGECSD